MKRLLEIHLPKQKKLFYYVHPPKVGERSEQELFFFRKNFRLALSY